MRSAAELLVTEGKGSGVTAAGFAVVQVFNWHLLLKSGATPFGKGSAAFGRVLTCLKGWTE